MPTSNNPSPDDHDRIDIASYQQMFRRMYDELLEKGALVLESFKSDSFTASALLEDVRSSLPAELAGIDPGSNRQFINAMAACLRKRCLERRRDRQDGAAKPVVVLPADSAALLTTVRESIRNSFAEQQEIPAEDVFVALETLDEVTRSVVNAVLVLGADEQYLQTTDILSSATPDDRRNLVANALKEFADVLLQRAPLPLPEKIGDKYKFSKRLGGGGFGEVWSAEVIGKSEYVAIKIPRPRTDQKCDLDNEAEQLRGLNIKGVPEFYELCDVKFTDGRQTQALVFEYIRGTTLNKVFEERSSKQVRPDDRYELWEWIANTMAKVADILQEVHRLRIWHWDLKPENILIDEHGKLWIVDFGLAKHDSQRLYLPETGWAGTPQYMSPEQVAGGRNLDGRSDIWSLGVILYQLISGRLPFDQLKFGELRKAICDVNPSAPALQHCDVPTSLQDICFKCLNKDPSDRYPNSEALAKALRNWNRPAPRPLPRPPLPAEKVREAQQKWKDYLDLPNGLVSYGNIALELIPPGDFKQGSPDNEGKPTERPQLDKSIERPFLMSTTCITQKQWRDEMNTEPWLKHGVPTGDDYPAVCISWDDAQKFCSRLSERLKEKWRLPTETEWEYACRAGTITKYSCDDADLPQYAWYLKTTIDAKLRPVATKLPNPFGLFDMHGGVWEWCQDEYRQNYDSGTTAAENSKVCRGGSTRIAEENIRSAARMGANAAKIHEIHGFRVVRELKQRQQFIT